MVPFLEININKSMGDLFMIKVVEAISDTNIGGAGILLLNRLKHTDRKLFDIIVLLPKNSALKERLRKIGIKTVEIEEKGDKSFSLKSLLAYIYAISNIKPDILNSHGSLNSRIAGSIVGVPSCVYTRHCVYPVGKIYKYAPVRFFFGKITSLLSDRIIAVAYAAKKNLMCMGVDPSQIQVIINGAEPLLRTDKKEREALKTKLGISTDKTVVSICARLEACKDHKTFLKAAKILSDVSDEYRFLILGDGSMRTELEEFSQKLGLEKMVTFTGFCDDVAPFMNITDINVNCSKGTETSSLALSEGMSLGIPCVVSNYGGNTYMVKNGVNGYVYPVGDYKALAKYIIKAREKRDVLSSESRLRFELELNAICMSEKIQKLYIELYKTKKAKRRKR